MVWVWVWVWVWGGCGCGEGAIQKKKFDFCYPERNVDNYEFTNSQLFLGPVNMKEKIPSLPPILLQANHPTARKL